MNNYNKDKGLFLQEFYGVEKIPALKTKDGTPTKFAEAAKYWGEQPPQNPSEVKQLVALGASLIIKENLSTTESIDKKDSSWYIGKENLSTMGSNLIKVPFIKKGNWRHDVYGEVSFTDKDVEDVITNYKNNVTGFTPYLTLGHLDEELDSTDSHRKRGDLNDIIKEGDTTYGIFKVSDEIYSRVENGEYEYSSGEFHRNFKSKEDGSAVGTTVLRVALTNSPFLPFGNQKIQALSENAESCPESKENFVFLLSLDANNSAEESKDTDSNLNTNPVEILSSEIELDTTNQTENPLNNIHINESIMTTETNVAETVNTVAPATVSPVAEQTAPATAPVTLEVQEEVVAKPTESTKENQGDQILHNLTSQLQKVQDLYAKQLEAANATIETLGKKVDALTDKLAGQEEVTQAFSTSMSAAQERSVIQNLQNNGVLPANIHKFLALKNAFTKSNDKNVVKFSVTANGETKEVEQNIIDAIADLIISTSNQTPVIEQQLGVSAGRRTGSFNFNSIIERNQSAAEKLNK
jgi:hypothetical protein